MRRVRFLLPGSDEVREGVLQGDGVRSGAVRAPLDAVRLAAPCRPTKIVCVGRNYAAHAAELGNEVPDRPLLFLKPPSAVIGPDDPIVLPRSDEVHYEAELAVVIARRCRGVKASQAMDVVLGYTCLNDVSDRVAQKWEKSWVRAKAFDGSAPMGPILVTADEASEPFRVRLRLNGEVRQDASTSAFIFSIPELIEEITSFMTLEAGDVIATGTPAGVGKLSPGDVVEVEIDGIGVLRNPVR